MDYDQITYSEAEDLIKKLELKKAEIETSHHSREDYLSFVRAVWPEFIAGYHHKKIAEKFNLIKEGKLERLIVNMPPRHTKSEFASFLFPAWMMGHNPKLKIIQTTHTAELSYRFGRKVRNLMDSEDYKNIFTDIKL